jgi:hypothetical protein
MTQIILTHISSNMNKKRALLSLIFGMAGYFCYSQKLDSLGVTSFKVSEDSVSRYKIVIENYSDSIVVLPHSVFFDINEITDEPLGLARYDTRPGMDFYTLRYAWGDTLTDPQRYPLAVNYILPWQKLEFKIATKPICRHCALTINYFRIYDFDYRTFLSTTGYYWERKYNVKSMTTIFAK